MRPADKPASPVLSAKDWVWVALGGLCLVCLCIVLVCVGVNHRMTVQSRVSATPSPSLVAPEVPLETAPVATVSVPDDKPVTTEHTIMHREAAWKTVDDLRRHSREDPNAPDALSEARIKAIEEQGALIK